MDTFHSDWKLHKCPHCPISYKRKTPLKKHISEKHENVRPFACDLCELTFTEQFKLDRHQSVHKGKLHQCPYCEKAFSQKQTLTSHIKDKHSDNPDYA